MPRSTPDGDCPNTWMRRVTIAQHFCTVGKPGSHSPRFCLWNSARLSGRSQPYVNSTIVGISDIFSVGRNHSTGNRIVVGICSQPPLVQFGWDRRLTRDKPSHKNRARDEGSAARTQYSTEVRRYRFRLDCMLREAPQIVLQLRRRLIACPTVLRQRFVDDVPQFAQAGPASIAPPVPEPC
jgi:hypothetical protein